MIVKGIIFDINGTLTDILTDETNDDVYRVISNLLSYQGIALDPAATKRVYFEALDDQRTASLEAYPELDDIEIFRQIMARYSTNFTRALPPRKLEQLPSLLAETFRAASRFRLELYPGVDETIRQLQAKHRLSVITDAQSAYAVPELNRVGLAACFDPVLVSGNVGYRKPDQRLFEAALAAMKMDPSEVLFVGNDMYRDVFGAGRLGIKTVFFRSNQGDHCSAGVEPDYIIHSFPELLTAIRFFEGEAGPSFSANQ